jgi:hypothetical protein
VRVRARAFKNAYLLLRGIRNETTTKQQQGTRVCLEEIGRCQEDSVGVNWFLLIGEK